MRELDKKYNFTELENKYMQYWNNNKTYTWKGEGDFVIDTPPPTVSGELHMGHIFSYCHTDFIARYQRMNGKDVFYPIGYDDNGLPTERLVEKIHKIKGNAINRNQFHVMCHETSNKARKKFSSFFKNMGISFDWNQEYHTISSHCQKISQASFIDLYKKGFIYKKLSPILWDITDQTAISQAEIEDKEFSSQMHYIRFYTSNNEKIIIATTRPELLPACTAVFFHPDDARYQHLKNQTSITPLCNAVVPILADDSVKIEKGSGLVMCCTFGDELDIFWWNKHNLPLKVILQKNGTLFDLDDKISNKALVSNLNGLHIKKARKVIIEALQNDSLIVKQVNIVHNVKCAERSDTSIEIIVTNQWFIEILKHKEVLLKNARQCAWHPSNMLIKIEKWIENVKWDWCISRQRSFGIPFPIWISKRLGEEGKIILADINTLPVDPLQSLPNGYTLDEVETDTDVMDTWATSSLSPQISANYLCDTIEFPNAREEIFPADLRSQSHEIIRTWAFYTIVKAQLHTNTIPWKNIMISGWCLAPDNTKMSKSKSNIISPENVLKTYGADVIRYWSSTARTGVDTIYSENTMKIGKKLVTKMWNSAKFVSLFLVDYKIEKITEPLDLWILHKLRSTITTSEVAFENFEYCIAISDAEEFFFKDFCDNYLELVKDRAYKTSRHGNESALNALSLVFHHILKLFAPFLPYITEEIYQALYDEEQSIHTSNQWPNKALLPYTNCNAGNLCILILKKVREYKAMKNISIKHELHKLKITSNNKEIATMEDDLKSACNVQITEWNLDAKIDEPVVNIVP